MIDKVPFDVYDFFGYLASGLVILLGMEMVLGFPHVLGHDLTVVDTAALILGAYVAGQCVAAPAKLVLEDGLVDKVLKRPSVNLFRDARPSVRRVLAPGYYQRLFEDRRKKYGIAPRTKGSMGPARSCSCTLGTATRYAVTLPSWVGSTTFLRSTGSPGT
jgi:hypothetical protein